MPVTTLVHQLTGRHGVGIQEDISITRTNGIVETTGLFGRHDIGPFPTTFTPDAACTRCYLRNFTEKFFHDMFSCEGYLTKGCNGHINRCFPASTVVTPGPEGTTALGFYSPGMSCPAAWRAWTAFTFGVSVTNEWAHIAELMRSDETALVCCPE